MSDHLCFAKIAGTRSKVFGMGDGDIENVDEDKATGRYGPGRSKTNRQTDRQFNLTAGSCCGPKQLLAGQGPAGLYHFDCTVTIVIAVEKPELRT